jgi:hypothetical protein
MDGYQIGGKQAAYANKKYQGHRALPACIFDDLAAALHKLVLIYIK